MGDFTGHPFRGNQWTSAQRAAMDRMQERALGDWRRREQGARDEAAEFQRYTPANRFKYRSDGVSMSRGDYLNEDPKPYGKVPQAKLDKNVKTLVNEGHRLDAIRLLRARGASFEDARDAVDGYAKRKARWDKQVGR